MTDRAPSLEEMRARIRDAVAASGIPRETIAAHMEVSLAEFEELLAGRRPLTSLRLALFAECTSSVVWYLITGEPTPVCTGLTARWCPIHGDCDCPAAEPDRCGLPNSVALQPPLDRPGCPLHGRWSTHAGRSTS